MPKLVRVAPSTWREMLPVLLMAVEYGDEEGKRMAYAEFKRMAEAADAYNDSLTS